VYFHDGFFFFCDSQIHKGHSFIFKLGKYFFIKKKLLARARHALSGCWPRCVRWHMRCHPVAKLSFHGILRFTTMFFSLWGGLWWQMRVGLCQRSFFFFYLSSRKECMFVLLFLYLSISVLMFFIVYSYSWFHYKSFKCFQLSPWIIIYHILFSLIISLFF
jgi:hypothetical protein